MLDDAPEALGVLANWPTGAAVPALAEVFAREQGDRRQEALAGLMRGLAKPDPRPVDETLALFGRLLATASTGQEYTEIFAALARVGDARALDLVTPFLSGRGIDAEAAMALDAVRRGLYRASASHKSGAAANAIDGIPETRWDTGAAQLGAEWFVLDLGLPYTIRAVTLDTTPSPVSYPGAVALVLSEDGQTWGEALAEQEGSEKVTLTIAPQRARYIKVSQTGRREAQLWSIHELTVDAVTGE
jgi:hypothetical protein